MSRLVVGIAVVILSSIAPDGGGPETLPPFRDCQECPVMVALPTGSFEMGATSEEHLDEGINGKKSVMDELPRHSVSVRRFSLGVTEVTRDQFAAFVKATGYAATGPCWVQDQSSGVLSSPLNDWHRPGFQQSGDHPVVCVSWHDANAYAAWLSKKTGKHYRLPTEAEWEYAARAGTVTARYWGNSVETCRAANVADLAAERALRWQFSNYFQCTDGYVFTAPVAKFAPNAFGLHDMLGNAWEWTADCYNASYTGAPSDGTAWLAGNCAQRVTRGASWMDVSSFVRAASRANDQENDKGNVLGFRVARSE